MAWPPYGPDVIGSSTNKIPAQVRYEELIGIDDPGDDNAPPAVDITSPAGGSNFAENSDILV